MTSISKKAALINRPKNITVDANNPMLFFGGPYSNIESLQALKAEADALQINPSQIVCTGDIFAYCASPQESIEFIRDWGIYCIKGNCEQAIIDDENDCGCGFEQDSLCSLLSDQWFSYCKKHINQQQRSWLSLLPDSICFDYNHLRILCFHASPSSNNEFIFASSSNNIFLEHCENINANIVISGHSGLPFTKSVVRTKNGINTSDGDGDGDDNKYIRNVEKKEATLWHNPGVIGMPANDGGTHTWYSVLSPNLESSSINNKTQQIINLAHKKLNYDYRSAYKKMIDNNCASGYAECLQNGIWPSLDVLLAKEKALSGQEIKETSWKIQRPL